MLERQFVEKISVEYARRKLGKKAEKMTDKQINDLLNMLRTLSNKVIDSVTNKVNIN